MTSSPCCFLVVCLTALFAAGCAHDTVPTIYESSTTLSSSAGNAQAAESALQARGFRPYPSKATSTLDLWYYRSSESGSAEDDAFEQTIQVSGIQSKQPILVRAACRYRPPVLVKHPHAREAALIAEVEDARRSVLDALTTNRLP
jgi:hypothetical protein